MVGHTNVPKVTSDAAATKFLKKTLVSGVDEVGLTLSNGLAPRDVVLGNLSDVS